MLSMKKECGPIILAPEMGGTLLCLRLTSHAETLLVCAALRQLVALPSCGVQTVPGHAQALFVVWSLPEQAQTLSDLLSTFGDVLDWPSRLVVEGDWSELGGQPTYAEREYELGLRTEGETSRAMSCAAGIDNRHTAPCLHWCADHSGQDRYMTQIEYQKSESGAMGAHETLRPTVGSPPVLRTPGWVNPYAPPLPAIARLLDYIWSCGAAGTLIETNNRDLALEIRCSAGLMPNLLERLIADGYITCVPHTRGTLIEVLR